jgi:hypothetical protein
LQEGIEAGTTEITTWEADVEIQIYGPARDLAFE